MSCIWDLSKDIGDDDDDDDITIIITLTTITVLFLKPGKESRWGIF